MSKDSWIGVDLDGTLAVYNGNQQYPEIGDPINVMVQRVWTWLSVGIDVRIFTARVSDPETAEVERERIDNWCMKVFNRKLPVTCCKDFKMDVLYDDRAIRVEKNTGLIK